MSDYLWDKSGPEDPDVAQLERALGALRYVPRAAPETPRRRRRWPVVAVAGVALAAAVLLFVETRGEKSISGKTELAAGQWVHTKSGEHAEVALGAIGTLDVAPDTRLRLVDASKTGEHLELARGLVHARVTAPPRFFVVDTPSAAAVDLGCEYSLSVDAGGRGSLHVAYGWVSLEANGRFSQTWAGASCETRPGAGPGTPSFDDAPAAMREALRAFDFDAKDDAARAAALDAALAAARPKDGLTLWHLMYRTNGESLQKTYARLVALSPPPPQARPDDAAAREPAAMGAWRNAMADSEVPR